MQAHTEDQLKNIVIGIIEQLRCEIPIKEIILFGSYAKGNPKEYTDIDLAVIADRFKASP